MPGVARTGAPAALRSVRWAGGMDTGKSVALRQELLERMRGAKDNRTVNIHRTRTYTTRRRGSIDGGGDGGGHGAGRSVGWRTLSRALAAFCRGVLPFNTNCAYTLAIARSPGRGTGLEPRATGEPSGLRTPVRREAE
jgi:hypothetical protein